MNLLIVEDEMVVAADLQDLLAGFGFTKSVVASNYTEAVRALETTPIHLALLDIHLGGYKSGIDVAQYIGANIAIPFIFLTAYEDLPTVHAALATSPHAYLQKPFGSATLYAALQLAINNFKKGRDSGAADEDSLIIRDSFFVKDKQRYVRVPLREVTHIRADGNYMELHTAERKHLVRIPQKVLLEQLPASFVKTSKSFIVNGAMITEVAADTISLGKISVDLAPNYRAELLERLKRLS